MLLIWTRTYDPSFKYIAGDHQLATDDGNIKITMTNNRNIFLKLRFKKYYLNFTPSTSWSIPYVG